MISVQIVVRVFHNGLLSLSQDRLLIGTATEGDRGGRTCLGGFDHLKTRVMATELSVETIVVDPDESEFSIIIVNIRDSGLVSLKDGSKLKSSIQILSFGPEVEYCRGLNRLKMDTWPNQKNCRKPDLVSIRISMPAVELTRGRCLKATAVPLQWTARQLSRRPLEHWQIGQHKFASEAETLQ